MKHSTALALLLLCMVIFANCSKKVTQTDVSSDSSYNTQRNTDYTPTESWHPPQMDANSKSSKTASTPTTKEGVFWIGSSLDHSFSIESGSINLSGVYAINNKTNLDVDDLGDLQFYPKKSLSDIEFFKSEIGNLDYQEGTYYQVEGTKYYLGTKLWGVIVNRVLQTLDTQELEDIEEEEIVMGGNNSTKTNKTTKTTRTTKRWKTSKKTAKLGSEATMTKKSSKSQSTSQNPPTINTTETWHPPVNEDDDPDEISQVSPNPPSIFEGKFWIVTDREGSYSSGGGGLYRYEDCFLLTNRLELEKNPEGEMMVFNGDEYQLLFFGGDFEDFDYDEGFLYQVEGMQYYSGEALKGVRVDKVLQKVKKYTTHITWNQHVRNSENKLPENKLPENKKDNASGKSSKTTRTTKRWKTSKETAKLGSEATMTKKSSESQSTSQNPPTINTTETWHPPVNEDDDPDEISQVSPNPPSIFEGKFWIITDREGSYSSGGGGLYRYEDCFLLTNRLELEKNPEGEMIVFDGDESHLLFFGGDFEDFDYDEGFLYQVEGMQYYSGEALKGVRVDKVLQKVKKYTTHISGNLEEGIWEVSPNPPSINLEYFWINSSKKGVLRTANGPIAYEDCIVTNNVEELDENQLGGLIFFNGDDSSIEFHCGDVKGLDYEEGYFYKVTGYTYESPTGETAFMVYDVIDKVEDKNFVKTEEMIVYIGPDKMKSYAFNGKAIECNQIQYGEYSQSAEWLAYCGSIAGFEPEPNYMYTLKIRRTHKSKREAEMVMDDFSIDDKLITILKKRRMY